MIRYMTEHPTASNLLMLVLIGMGIYVIPDLRRETFPDRGNEDVEIRVPYPGATAEDVEEAICQRIEDALDGVRFMHELRSEARESIGIVVAEMEEGQDMRQFLDDVTSEVEAIDDFPDDAEDPVITELGTTDQVLVVLATGPMEPPDLKAYCEDFKDRLQRVDGISLVTVQGFSDHQFRVELSAGSLRRHGLSVQDVAGTISRQNINLPAGTVEARERDILIRLVEERRSVQQIEDIVILGEVGGAEVRLRDIGRVVDLFEVAEDKVMLGDRRAGLIRIEKTKNQDALRVAETVKQFVSEERSRHPQVDLRITQDTSVLVADRLQMLIKNGWQGILLVFAVLWLFFNVKLSFWVAMSLPVSFLGAFYFLPLLDLTINMITMVGLLLALGLLMDDGIVIAENIATHRARGTPPLQAAIDGVVEVRAGVISSFLTTICVLGPLVTITGEIGKVLKVVPMVLIMVMAVSLIEAFCILPAHLGHSLHGNARASGRFRGFFDGLIETMRERIVGRLVDVALRWRYLAVGLTVLAFLASISLMIGGVLRFKSFPDLDGDVVSARVLLPQGTPLQRTEQIVEQITDALDRVNTQFKPQQPDQQDLVKTVNVQFNVNTDAFESGAHVATVTVDLLSAETRIGRTDDVVNAWRAEAGLLPDVLSLSFAEPAFGPSGIPIEVRLAGDDLPQLKSAATELLEWFNRFEGVFNLTDDLRPGKPELRLRLREGALAIGLDASTLSRQLRGAFQGVTADEIQVGSESYEIDVRLTQDDQNSVADLEEFDLTLADGTQVPLTSVAAIESGTGWARIARVDGQRVVTLRGDLDARVANTANIFREFRRTYLDEFREKHPNVQVTIKGETEQSETTEGSMRRAMLIGLMGVFVLLSFQFRSYIEPLVVMVAIPLSLIGVIWGHLLMGVDLSMPSMMGFVSLAGVVVNDSILLVLFLKSARNSGADPEVAAAQSSRQRFRAILLTSLTTIAGLLPLLAERSLQAQVLIPLAISIAFGLLASTVLVLIIIPCIYVILSDFGLTTDHDSDR